MLLKLILLVLINVFIKQVSLETTVPPILLETQSYNVTGANETYTQLNTTSQESTAPTYQEINNSTEAGIEKKFGRSSFILRRLSDIYDTFDSIVDRIGIGGFIAVCISALIVFMLLTVGCTILCCRICKCYRIKSNYNRKPRYKGKPSSDKYVYEKLIHDPEEL